MTEAERIELHYQVWGKCPLCQRNPNFPNGSCCEDCETRRRIKLHGMPQNVRTDKRYIERDEEL